MTVYDYLAKDLASLDRCISTQLHSDVSLVQQVAAYIVGAGGKRIRPVMMLLAAHALEKQAKQPVSGASIGLNDTDLSDARHISLAAVIEFIHTATLLHDDVVDESDQRRGKSTANALFGNAASVLVGDFLYSRAFQMMAACKHLGVMDILSDATNVIAEGEVLQLMHIGDVDLTQAQYLKVIEYKTAKLFEAAARLPAVLLGDVTAELALANYGRKVGAAFQIVDDVLDYRGKVDQMGKNLGDDLQEGKITLPIIFVFERASTVDIDWLKNLFLRLQDPKNSAINPLKPAELNRVQQLIDVTDAANASILIAQGLVDEAVEGLSSLPNSRAKTLLSQLAFDAVRRQF